MTIDYFSLGHPLARIRSRYALRARRALLDLCVERLQPTAEWRVLDLGVTPDRSLPESNFFELLYPWKHRIVAASIEDASWMELEHPGLKFVRIAPGRLPFDDDQFDLVFCSAVIEHVGSREDQRAFARETLRVGKRFFLTTPNRQFPLEFHTLLPFIHWLPQALHQRLLRMMGFTFWARTENLNLLTPGAFGDLMPPCRSLTVYTYKLLGMPSNIAVFGVK